MSMGICNNCMNYPCTDEMSVMLKSCPAYNPIPKPQTNGDRIRGMSDYDMADWIADILNHCDNKNPEDECLESCPLYACCNLPFDNIENWLKSPAESSVFESMKRGLEQAINGETRSETLTKDGDEDV